MGVKVLANVVVVVLNYLFSKLLIFKGKQAQ
jgi:putative flippase GtrA